MQEIIQLYTDFKVIELESIGIETDKEKEKYGEALVDMFKNCTEKHKLNKLVVRSVGKMTRGYLLEIKNQFLNMPNGKPRWRIKVGYVDPKYGWGDVIFDCVPNK